MKDLMAMFHDLFEDLGKPDAKITSTAHIFPAGPSGFQLALAVVPASAMRFSIGRKGHGV